MVFESETLKLVKLHDNVYQHISYLSDEKYGKVACNGLVVISEGKASVIDTPAEKNAASELISWVENEMKSKITAVIPTHFHNDCLGTLEFFHENGAASYAHEKTISLAKNNAETLPNEGFQNQFEFIVGNEKIECTYYGPGHTNDNIVVYVPKANILFGGCLVKSLGAGKGNLNDADVQLWSKTVEKIKERHMNTNIMVIPGHGALGGMDLLEYTITMFH